MMATEIIVCPICNVTIWSEKAEPFLARASLPSASPHGANMLTEMMLESQRFIDEKAQRAEEACRSHFENTHPRRLRLWKKYRWRWLMTRRWPWSRTLTGDGLFEVKT